ncbi:MAG: hypothetical protein U5J83_11770 [Bryobacterales bacterium]|nr:hypothetical protein [Bryobacterales bacterium]
MSVPEQLPADQFVQRFRDELIPLTSKIRWFSLVALAEEDLGVSIREPLESLPPALARQLPQLHLFLVPFLRSAGRQADLIMFEGPDPKERSDSFQIIGPDNAALVIATQDISPNEYHYNLFNAVSSLAWEVAPAEIAGGGRSRSSVMNCGGAVRQSRSELPGSARTRWWRSKANRPATANCFVDTFALPTSTR